MIFRITATVAAARSALAGGAAAALLMLAMLGVYEYLTGGAARGILVSAAMESLLAVGFMRAALGNRRATAAA